MRRSLQEFPTWWLQIVISNTVHRRLILKSSPSYVNISIHDCAHILFHSLQQYYNNKTRARSRKRGKLCIISDSWNLESNLLFWACLQNNPLTYAESIFCAVETMNYVIRSESYAYQAQLHADALSWASQQKVNFVRELSWDWWQYNVNDMFTFFPQASVFPHSTHWFGFIAHWQPPLAHWAHVLPLDGSK